MRIQRYQNWGIAIFLIVLVTLLRLPSLDQPFDNDSGANAYHGRLIAQGEPLYTTHHSSHHLPAVYYSYAAAFLLFGDSVWAVKFFLLLWTIVTVYLIYLFGYFLDKKLTGFLAAIFYAVLSASLGLMGTSAEIELFANLPRIASVFILLYLTAHHAPAWRYIFVGLITAISFYFKAVYITPLILAAIVLIVDTWYNRTEVDVRSHVFTPLIWVVAGFFIGIFIVIFYFGSLGLLSRLGLVFVIGQTYIRFRTASSSHMSILWLLHPVIALVVTNFIISFFAMSGFIFTIINHKKRNTQLPEKTLLMLYINVWLLLSYIEANVSRAFFMHYYLLVLPPLCLLASWFLVDLYQKIKTATSQKLAVVVLLGLLWSALFVSIRANYNYYNHFVRYKLGIETFETFIEKGWGNTELLELQELADYIQQNTTSDDYIYYWSGNMQLYYLSNRRAPIDIIWPIYIEATGPYNRIFTPQTKYIIVGESNNIPQPDWLYPELEKSYDLETIIAGQEFYRRRE
ncbi:hypothetical protein QUF63_00290 [Anaerolineales bacterium HSG25]|nr:hypothetical protein [Anaerolineales bacterium HSG25]